VLLGFTLMIPAIGLMMFVRNEYAFLVFAAQLGFATAFLWPAAYAISADLYPPERRGKVIGFLNLAQLLGFGVGALSGAFLVTEDGRWQFAVALVAVALAFLAALRGIPPYRGGRFLMPPSAEVRPSLRSIASPRLAWLSAIILGASIGLAMVVPVIRPYGANVLEVSFTTLTLALVPAIAVGVLLFVPAGDLADRYGRWRPFFAGQLLIVVGLLTLSVTASLPVAMFAAMVVFGGNVLTVPAWNAAIMDLAPESHRGTMIGLSVALSGLGLAVGPAIGGFISGEWGAQVAFRFAAGVCALTSLGILAYARRYPAPAPAIAGPEPVERGAQT
jgi:MFS family permease